MGIETKNINNPLYSSDVSGGIVVKGAFVEEAAGFMVRIRPYLAFLPDRTVIGRNYSTDVRVDLDNNGGSTIVTLSGMERWVTICLKFENSGGSYSVTPLVIAGTQAPVNEAQRPERGAHYALQDGNVIILADVRMYYNMTQVTAEDISTTRSETANYIDPALIPIEVYGPPLDQYKSVDEVIRGINDGALDWRYVTKDDAPYVNFKVYDLTGCSVQDETPDGVKHEGSLFAAKVTEVCGASDIQTVLIFNNGSEQRKLVTTSPPAGFTCGTCDVTCDTCETDAEIASVCGNCQVATQTFCDVNCQTGCEVVCDSSDTAASCGSACQTTCESACQQVCEVFSQTSLDPNDECVNQCDVTCQNSYQTT